jgi:eukaryotic-like serine/threonine-protein kinase
MGVVWLAYDEVLHRPVAVKEVQLPAGMPSQEANAARERTLREARAIAALTHPNVVAVHDVAKEGVEPFVVMELLSGRSLAQLLNRGGPLNSEQAASIADAVAAGLDAAHRRGITHRDVKPGNVLVGADGQVKLTDFGIARNVSEVTMTSSGLILGTPAYIAPEVAEGDDITSAVDLWGLGATLFAAVEGRPPFDKGDPMETINEVVQGEIPRPRPDAPLADVIAGLMVREPADRISLVEVRRRIRALLPEPGTNVFPVDDSDQDAGPADEKPTTSLSAGGRAADSAAVPARALAVNPGPLPFGGLAGLPQPGAGSAGAGAAGLAGVGSSGVAAQGGGVGAASVPLTPAPGPLPFDRPPLRVRRRHPGVTAALLVLAVVLFVIAAGTGFVAARTLAGRSIRPPVTQPASLPPQAPPVRAYNTETAQAGVPGTGEGNFTLQVPTGWVKFVEQHAQQQRVPSSTAVHWVKQDGTFDMGVERFPDFYPKYTVDDYLRTLVGTMPGTQVSQPAAPTPAPSGSTAQQTADVEYRTVDTDRTLWVSFRQQGTDLWVLTLTVPTDQEGSATWALFEKMKGDFTPQ